MPLLYGIIYTEAKERWSSDMTKGNAYKKNTFGKFAGDFLGKSALIRKARRKARQQARLACKVYA